MKVAHIAEKLGMGTAPQLRSEKLSAQLTENLVQNAIMAIITHRCAKSVLEKQMLSKQRNDPLKQAQTVKMKLALSGSSTTL